MESFYRHLTAGIGNAAALRETKLEMLKKRQKKHDTRITGRLSSLSEKP